MVLGGKHHPRARGPGEERGVSVAIAAVVVVLVVDSAATVDVCRRPSTRRGRCRMPPPTRCLIRKTSRAVEVLLGDRGAGAVEDLAAVDRVGLADEGFPVTIVEAVALVQDERHVPAKDSRTAIRSKQPPPNPRQARRGTGAQIKTRGLSIETRGTLNTNYSILNPKSYTLTGTLKTRNPDPYTLETET